MYKEESEIMKRIISGFLSLVLLSVALSAAAGGGSPFNAQPSETGGLSAIFEGTQPDSVLTADDVIAVTTPALYAAMMDEESAAAMA